jgi:hypothetical protein
LSVQNGTEIAAVITEIPRDSDLSTSFGEKVKGGVYNKCLVIGSLFRRFPRETLVTFFCSVQREVQKISSRIGDAIFAEARFNPSEDNIQVREDQLQGSTQSQFLGSNSLCSFSRAFPNENESSTFPSSC